MKKINNILRLSIILLISSCSNNNIIVKYDIIKQTDSQYIVLKLDVKKENIQGEFYRKRFYNNSLLTKIIYYNPDDEIYSNVYQNAITTYSFVDDSLIITLFDKDMNKVENEFLGYNTNIIIFDNKNRVVKKLYKDKYGNYTEFSNELDIVPPIIEYQYIDNKCYEIIKSKEDEIIEKKKLTKKPKLDDIFRL